MIEYIECYDGDKIDPSKRLVIHYRPETADVMIDGEEYDHEDEKWEMFDYAGRIERLIIPADKIPQLITCLERYKPESVSNLTQ